jgi:hypothetical protein
MDVKMKDMKNLVIILLCGILVVICSDLALPWFLLSGVNLIYWAVRIEKTRVSNE